MTSFFLVCFKEAVVTLPASEPASSADVESVIPSLQTIIHPHFTRRLLGSFVPRGRHTLMHRPRKKGRGVRIDQGCPRTALLVLSAPVSKKNKCGGLKRRLSPCGQSGITLSALQAVQMHVSVLAHVPPKPVNLCESVCTPAIFLLAFIPACQECLFSCPNTSVQAVWKKQTSKKKKKAVVLVRTSKFRKGLFFWVFLFFRLVLHSKNEWCFYTKF